MKYPIRYKLAAVIAFLIGLMSVVAGSRVLMGISTPDYHVLDWLVAYNVIVGLLSIVVSFLIWKKYRRAFAASLLIAASHISVFVLLISVFNEITAAESIKAMIFRVVVWSVIIMLSMAGVKEPKVFI
jgi:hypothetical protein